MHSAKLCEVVNNQAKVISQGLEVLKRSNPRNPFRLITVMGPSHTGKSFLISFLLQEENAFYSSNGKPMIKGIDISTPVALVDIRQKLMDSCKILNGFQGRKLDPDIRVAFADLEVMGDRGEDYDLRLELPSLLTSSVLIFNFKSELSKSKLLERLAVFEVIASKIENHMYLNGDNEDKRQRGSLFGHLHLVFRDWNNAWSPEEYRSLLLNDEATGTFAERKEIEERNLRCKRVLETFASVKIHFLPSAAVGSILSKYDSLPFDKVHPEFHLAALQMLESIAADASSDIGPSLGGFKAPGAPIIGYLFEDLIVKANHIEDVTVSDVLRNCWEKECSRCAGAATEVLSPVPLPMAPAALAAALGQQRKNATEKYRGDAAAAPEDIRERYYASLVRKCEDHLRFLSEKNEADVGARVTDACAQIIAQARSRIALPMTRAQLIDACERHIAESAARMQAADPVLNDASVRALMERVLDPLKGQLEVEVSELNEVALQAGRSKVNTVGDDAIRALESTRETLISKYEEVEPGMAESTVANVYETLLAELKAMVPTYGSVPELKSLVERRIWDLTAKKGSVLAQLKQKYFG